jgi:hypothetical protein
MQPIVANACQRPPFLKIIGYRIRHLLITRGEWSETPATPIVGYTDITVLEQRMHINFTDRMRILFGGIPALRTMIHTEFKAGATRAITDTKIE